MKMVKLLNIENIFNEMKALIKINFDCVLNRYIYPHQKCTGREKHIIYLIPGIGGHPKHLNWLKYQLEINGFHTHLARTMKPIGILDLKLHSGIKRLIVLYKKDLEKIKEEHPHVQKIIIIGHSLGGLIALSLLLWKKKEFNHIIALGSPINSGVKKAEILAKFFKTAKDISPQSQIFKKINRIVKNFSLNSKITAIIGKQDFLVSKKEGVLPFIQSFFVKSGHIGLIRNKKVLEKILLVLYKQLLV